MNKFLFGNAKNAAMAIARIAIMMALTILMQYLTGLLKIQLLTGSVVNLFLLLSAMLTGLIGGVAVGFITPFIAIPLNLNPHIIAAPFIAFANAAFVAVFCLTIYLLKLKDQNVEWKRIAVLVGAIIIAAIVKFLLMYLFAQVIFPAFFAEQLGQKLEPIKIAFGVTQLFTALMGGAVATALYYPLRAAKLITPAVTE